MMVAIVDEVVGVGGMLVGVVGDVGDNVSVGVCWGSWWRWRMMSGLTVAMLLGVAYDAGDDVVDVGRSWR